MWAGFGDAVWGGVGLGFGRFVGGGLRVGPRVGCGMACAWGVRWMGGACGRAGLVAGVGGWGGRVVWLVG